MNSELRENYWSDGDTDREGELIYARNITCESLEYDLLKSYTTHTFRID
jgi:hypothetical protein